MSISNAEDIIDSRDVIEFIAELESEREALHDEYSDIESDYLASDEEDDDFSDIHAALKECNESCETWDEERGEELKALKALADEAQGYAPDWHHGEALIRRSYFVDYAQQLADDIGAVDSNLSWPNTCIDWEEAADQLEQDYTSVDYDGVEYLIR